MSKCVLEDIWESCATAQMVEKQHKLSLLHHGFIYDLTKQIADCLYANRDSKMTHAIEIPSNV
jgi:hypothetical protein